MELRIILNRLASLAVITLASAASAQDTDAQRQANRTFFEREFATAGFDPLRTSASTPVGSVRLLVYDPYVMMAVPGISVDQYQDGRVELVVQYRGWRSRPTILPASAWDRLVAARATDTSRQPIESGGARTNVVCHGWSTATQTDDSTVVSWHGCGTEPIPALAVTVMSLAIEHASACPIAQTIVTPDRYAGCVTTPAMLDDPELETAFRPIMAGYSAEPGAEILGAARMAVRNPAARLGNPEWLRARTAVAAHAALLRRQRDRLQALQMLIFRARVPSMGDRVRINRAIAGMTEFLAAQDRNHVELLTSLVDK